jgi:four helix bundle protein
MLEKHRSLIAWQRADDLYVHAHSLTRARFPPDERYGLTGQIRRAAFSVAANIVEGFSRRHERERVQFLQIAWGSLQEVAYGLHAAHRLGLIDDAEAEAAQNHVKNVAAPLAGLMRSERRAMAHDTGKNPS